MYWVYIHTNKVTGKKYVGQTTQDNPAARWGKEGSGYGVRTKIYKAIKSYGWDNFSHEIISCSSLDEMNQKERALIAYYNTTDDRFGYNIELGGNGKGKHSEETRKKLSKSLTGRHLSEEHRKKMSEALRGKPKSEEAKKKLSELRKGKPHSEEHKRRISETMKGRPSPNKGLVKEKALYQNSETGQIREMAVQHHKNPRWIRIN